jgi:hypothetical protein
MAEINDVYRLDFDADEFSARIDAAINKLNELESAADGAASSAGDLDDATSELSSALKIETTSIDGLSAKRNTLVKTQQSLNKESRAGVLVGGEITKTNSKIASSTAAATTQNKSFYGSLVNGARGLNSMRRAASLVSGVFRVIAGISVFGLLAQAIPFVIGLFGQLTGSAKSAKTELDRLDDPETGLQERKSILEAELTRFKILEAKSGELNDEQKKQRDELQQKYKETADEIERIESERIKRIQKLEIQNQRLRIKLLTNASQQARESAKLDIAELFQDLGAQQTAIFQEINRLAKERDSLRARGRVNEANAVEQALTLLQKESDALIEQQNIQKKVIEQESAANQGRIASATQLSTSLAALQAELSRLQKIQREQTNATNANELNAIQQQIDAQFAKVETAKKLLADIQGVADAEVNINKLKNDLIEDDFQRRVSELTNAATKEKNAVVGNAEQKAEQQLLIEQKLILDIADLRKKQIEQQEKDAINLENDRIARIKSALETEKSIEDERLSIRLQGIETRRNAELLTVSQTIQDAEKRNESVEAVNKKYDAERIAAEKLKQGLILESEIKAVQNIIEVRQKLGESTVDESAQIEDLKLKLVELGRTDPTVKIDADTKDAKSKLAEMIKEIAEAVITIGNAVFDAVSAANQRLIAQLDKAVDRSKTALDEIRANSQDFNARQLALEKERLENLEKERARAVEREKAIAITRIAIDTTIAVAKAASQTGVGAPIAIAATIAAIIGGIASALSVAQGAAFYEGSEYIDKENRFPSGRDTVPARLNKGERVITTETNRKYFPVLSAIHNGEIPANALNEFAGSYMNGNGSVSVLKEVGSNPIIVPMMTNNSGMEKRLERIESALLNLPKYMPSVSVGANASGVFKIVETRQRRAENVQRIAGR